MCIVRTYERDEIDTNSKRKVSVRGIGLDIAVAAERGCRVRGASTRGRHVDVPRGTLTVAYSRDTADLQTPPGKPGGTYSKKAAPTHVPVHGLRAPVHVVL